MVKLSEFVISRLLRAAMKSSCRFKVAAAGLDSRGNLLAIAVNRPRLESRGYHAEEVLLFGKGVSRHRRQRLHTLVLVRLGARGDKLPIDPCRHCEKLLKDRGIKVLRA